MLSGESGEPETGGSLSSGESVRYLSLLSVVLWQCLALVFADITQLLPSLDSLNQFCIYIGVIYCNVEGVYEPFDLSCS